MATHSYDNGGQPDGTLDVSVAMFYGEEYVCLDLVNGDSGAHLTADQALELAADLIAHANTLTKPSPSPFRLPDGTWRCTRDGVTEPCGDCDGCRQVASENAIAAAMTEAQDHPGRIVTR